MRYVLKNNELCDFNNNMQSLINNEINEKITTMQTIAEKTEWVGSGRDSFIDYYDEVMREINKIPKILSLYTNYLTNVSMDYDDALSEVQKEIQSLKTETDYKKDGDINV